jgi:N6-L-threonylcarbamoyladenine synthase
MLRFTYELHANMTASSSAFTVLGLETSCDETAAAIVRGRPPGPGEVLSNVVRSQIQEHRPYGGVVPEIAARAHVELLDTLVENALAEAGLGFGDVDAVAATAGPGLIGGVMVGLTMAKSLAMAADRPLVAVNHLEAHALTARLTDGIPFPFLLLLISGGHCQLLAVDGVGRYRLYGTTIDDAVGEAFDKTAKLLDIGYPGGPAIEALAASGNPKRFALPRPMLGREGADFSLSGLKTAVRQIARGESLDASARADLAAAFQSAVVDVLVDRTRSAMRRYAREIDGGRLLVVAGGVAANRAIGRSLADLCEQEGFQIRIPAPRFCTDNAAMVAWTGIERCELGLFDDLSVAPKARWQLHLFAAERRQPHLLG